MDRAELEEYLRDRPRRLAEHLKGEEMRQREEIERAIASLKKERWRLYMRLHRSLLRRRSPARASRSLEDGGIGECGP